MGRIAEAFARAEREQRAALVIYLCAGDPDLQTTTELVVAAAEAGADVIELGMPFSDPTADGPAIQRASERALRSGTTIAGVLRTVTAIRERTDVPLLLFGYYNPVLAFGEAALVESAAAVGVDGFLIVDLPPEEATTLRESIVAHGLDFVPLVAPTSDAERVELAAAAATSFVYYVSMTGVTGAQASDLHDAAGRAEELQRKIGRPVALGFGVKTKADVVAVSSRVAGVVVGSAVVRVVEGAPHAAEAVRAVRGLVTELASGLTRQN